MNTIIGDLKLSCHKCQVEVTARDKCYGIDSSIHIGKIKWKIKHVECTGGCIPCVQVSS